MELLTTDQVASALETGNLEEFTRQLNENLTSKLADTILSSNVTIKNIRVE
ncbi:MAG: hypothetical protein ABIA04_14965 [Pseudomonadota bacterium]